MNTHQLDVLLLTTRCEALERRARKQQTQLDYYRRVVAAIRELRGR